MKPIVTIIVAFMLALSLTAVVSACSDPEHSPVITLSPPQGFAMTIISGSGFDELKSVSITYDGVIQPTVPMSIQTNASGCFTAIIAVPDELAVGTHNITATDSQGCSASATFTVVNMEGPQGPAGPEGPQGAQGVAGQNGLNGINGVNGTNGTNGTNGLDFNSTGNIFVYNGTDGINGQNGANFNATGNILVYNGTNGLNGINGISGRDGTNGINGINGINGKDGINGTQGPIGPQGVSGKVVFTDPPQPGGMSLDYLIAILAVILIVFTALLLAVYRKSKG